MIQIHVSTRVEGIFNFIGSDSLEVIDQSRYRMTSWCGVMDAADLLNIAVSDDYFQL